MEVSSTPRQVSTVGRSCRPWSGAPRPPRSSRAEAAVDADAVRANADSATRDLAARLTGWATAEGMRLRETPASTELRRDDGTLICQLYYKAGTLDIDLGTLRRNDPDLADATLQHLQQMTPKRITQTYCRVDTASRRTPERAPCSRRHPAKASPNRRRSCADRPRWLASASTRMIHTSWRRASHWGSTPARRAAVSAAVLQPVPTRAGQGQTGARLLRRPHSRDHP